MTIGAALGEPDQIDAGAAADVEHRLAAHAVERDQAQQVVQLLEVVLVEIGEEARRCPAGWLEISRSWMCVFQ